MLGGATRPTARSPARSTRWRASAEAPCAATLNGVLLRAGADIGFLREFGRAGPPPVRIAGGGRRATFDRRFGIDLPPGVCEGALQPFGLSGRGGAVERTLPMLLDADGRMVAAHPMLAGRLAPSTPLLAIGERVGWRIRCDLPGPAVRARAAPGEA